jgi:hypothetical protein
MHDRPHGPVARGLLARARVARGLAALGSVLVGCPPAEREYAIEDCDRSDCTRYLSRTDECAPGSLRIGYVVVLGRKVACCQNPEGGCAIP